MNTKKDASVLSLFISKKTKHLISLYSFSGRALPLAPAFQNSIPEPDHSPFHTAFWPVPLFQKSAGGGLSYKAKNLLPVVGRKIIKSKKRCMDTYHLDMLPAPLFYMLFLYVFPICIHSLFRQMHESYNIAATRRRIIYPAVPTAILTNVLCFHL